MPEPGFECCSDSGSQVFEPCTVLSKSEEQLFTDNATGSYYKRFVPLPPMPSSLRKSFYSKPEIILFVIDYLLKK